MNLILRMFYRYNITFTFINREVMLHKCNTYSRNLNSFLIIKFFNNILKNKMHYFTD